MAHWREKTKVTHDPEFERDAFYSGMGNLPEDKSLKRQVILAITSIFVTGAATGALITYLIMWGIRQ